MRKVLIFCIAIFLILLITPLTTALTTSNIHTKSPDIKPQVTENSGNSKSFKKDRDLIIRSAISISDESFCDETLKAALSIAENNYLYSLNNSNENNTLPLEYSDEFYNRISKIYEEVDISITYKGEVVYIPVSSLSQGFTGVDDDYPYMKSVASPWDCLSEEFIYDKAYTNGVSMNGLNYLCENETSYKAALKWYLPAFEIK